LNIFLSVSAHQQHTLGQDCQAGDYHDVLGCREIHKFYCMSQILLRVTKFFVVFD
jgi:hypothetical protein